MFNWAACDNVCFRKAFTMSMLTCFAFVDWFSSFKLQISCSHFVPSANDALVFTPGFLCPLTCLSLVTSTGSCKIYATKSITKEGLPCGPAGKESACNAGGLGLIPGLGRSPGEGKGFPLQCSGLENSMECIVHGVAKSRTWLSDFHFTGELRVLLEINILTYTNKSLNCVLIF